MFPTATQKAGIPYRKIPLALGLSALAFVVFSLSGLLSGCSGHGNGDPMLTQNTYLELVDWHVAGLWVINCPVAWFRVANYNNVPITNIQVEYVTYDYDGQQLNKGIHVIEDKVVPPGGMLNIIEQYLGLVDLHSDKLSVRLVGVSAAH